MTLRYAPFAPGDDLLKVLEGSEVDGAVWKHANETHGKTTVEGANATGSPHLASSGGDQGIAVQSTFSSLILDTAGLESVIGLLNRKVCMQFRLTISMYQGGRCRIWITVSNACNI